MVLISFITPFYHGNQFVGELVNCISLINKAIYQKTGNSVELIVVNDSPDDEVDVHSGNEGLPIKIINNKKNVGIQASRVNGLRYAVGEWINFLDQDDLLIPEQYCSYLQYTERADVIIANGYYEKDGKRIRIYETRRKQDYYTKFRQLIQIRNLIPSPGECIIRKNSIPQIWMEKALKCNGADDWLLWLILYSKSARFICNYENVYIHRTTENGNLSFDYDKMHASCKEMIDILEQEHILSTADLYQLRRAIDFKYLKDTKKITIVQYIQYIDCVIHNVIYKLQ